MTERAPGPIVEVEGLTFRYRRATEPAIRDVSLTVSPGEVVLVAGPSGCGKSTLIRAINGLIPHAYSGDLSGTVKVDGQSTSELKLRDLARTIGTVLQDPAKQIVGAMVESELAFGPENMGVPREEIRDRIREVAEQAGIQKLLGRETSALSGGERQLLAVAGILMLRPRLFVVDEPLANLDPATAERLLALLRSLADEGSAIVIVEHRVEECLDLRPDRVLYLEAGSMRYIGDVDGFLGVADPESVKLPFEVVLDRVAAGSPDEEPVVTTLAERQGSALDATPRLEFRGVDIEFLTNLRSTLEGIDEHFGPQETVAVLGPNGSGKTTMFRTAMRLLELTGGAVLVDGESIADKRTIDLVETFGYVFQSPSQMLFNRTVVDELLFGPRTLGHDEATFDELVDDVLRRTSLADLEDIRERPPLAMSFGQQKRLALAIALALRPTTLILDEPSAGQDHRTAQIFMREVTAIPGLESLYFVTHDVDLALTHADRILLFRDGRVIADGSPMEVIADTARWRACDLRVTSLMEANARYGSAEGKFLDADTLARRVIAQDPARRRGSGREATAGGLLTDH